MDGLVQRRGGTVDRRHAVKVRAHEIAEGLGRVRALLRGREADIVSRVDDVGQLRRFTVEQDDRRRRHRRAEELPLAVERERQVRAGLPDQVAVAVAVHHQDIPHDEHAAAEQFRRLAIEQDDIAVVDQAQARRDRDAERRRVLRVVEVVFLAVGVLLKLIARDGDAGRLDAQLLRHALLEPLQLAAAAGEEHRGGHLVVELQNTLGELLRQRRDGGRDHVADLLARHLMGQAEDIRVADLVLIAQQHLDPLRLGKIDEQHAHHQLRNLVAGDGRHGVAHDAAVAADGDIGRARADVDEHEVQQADVVGDRGVEGGDRLERQAGDLQPQLADHGVEALHHLPRQEGHDDLRFNAAARVVADAGHGIAVHPIGGDGVANHVIEVVLQRRLLPQRMLRLGDRAGFELVDQLLGNLARGGKLQRKGRRLGFERAPRRGDADAGEVHSGLLFQPRDDLAGDLRHLLDVLDLAVEHGALAVILLFDGHDMEAPAFGAADHADDAAGADVQREDLVLLLLSLHFRHNRTCLSCCKYVLLYCRGPLVT